MEGTGDDSVELEDPREWRSEEVATFQRWQQIVRSTSENLDRQLHRILEQEQTHRERDWP